MDGASGRFLIEMQPAFPFMVDWPEELLAQQRAAIVTYRLARGERLTTTQVGQITGMGYVGAWLMMTKISEVTPIYRENGCWMMLAQN